MLVTPTGQPAESFRSTESGLLVPSESSRTREVWTRDEWALMNRVGKLLKARELAFNLACLNPGCEGPMQMVVHPTGHSLRCGCKDRVFQRAF